MIIHLEKNDRKLSFNVSSVYGVLWVGAYFQILSVPFSFIQLDFFNASNSFSLNIIYVKDCNTKSRL
jgi:hypothetical protein